MDTSKFLLRLTSRKPDDKGSFFIVYTKILDTLDSLGGSSVLKALRTNTRPISPVAIPIPSISVSKSVFSLWVGSDRACRMFFF